MASNCKEVRHIIIIIIPIIYIFLSYVIFDQQLKITLRKSSGPPEKIHSPFLLTLSLKIQKVQAHPFLPILKVFQAPLQKGREETMLVIAVNKVSVKYCLQIVLKYHWLFPWINTLMINIPCITVNTFGILNILSKINETIVSHISKMEYHFSPFISVY